MAEPSKQAASRPLSPHIGVWRWGPGMIVSILHRATGNALAVAGGAVLVWWLWAIASGPESYAAFHAHARSWYGLTVLIGISWAFFHHLISGLRHLVMDAGAGYELTASNRWSTFLPLLSVLFTGAFWMFALLPD